MTITAELTKSEGSIGIEKSDNIPEGIVPDKRFFTTAAQLERMKTALIDLVSWANAGGGGGGGGGVGPFVLKYSGSLACSSGDNGGLLADGGDGSIDADPAIAAAPAPIPFSVAVAYVSIPENSAVTDSTVKLFKNGEVAGTVTLPAGDSDTVHASFDAPFGAGDLFSVGLANSGGGSGNHVRVIVTFGCNPLSPIDPDAADATADEHGLMSAADKAKLNGIESGAQAVSAARVAAALETDTAFNIGDGSLGSPIQIQGQSVTIVGDGDGSVSITGLGAPAAPADAATKAYVDAIAQGLSIKQSVRVATTTNGTLATAFANGQTVDGVVLATGDRILLKDQTTGADRGIYTVNASGAPTRAVDWDSFADLAAGAFVFVEEGTANADSGWVLTTNGAIVVGTTAIAFTQFSGAGQIVAGSGIVKSANQLSADFGTGAGKVTQGNDSRLSDSRTPTGHAASHVGGGSDAIAIAIAAGAAGLMSGSDKSKLDGITVGTHAPVFTNETGVSLSAAAAAWTHVTIGGVHFLFGLMTLRSSATARPTVDVSVPTTITTLRSFLMRGQNAIALQGAVGQQWDGLAAIQTTTTLRITFDYSASTTASGISFGVLVVYE